MVMRNLEGGHEEHVRWPCGTPRKSSFDFRVFLDSDYNEFSIAESCQDVAVAVGNSHASNWYVKCDSG